MSLKFDHSKFRMSDAIGVSEQTVTDAKNKKAELMMFMFKNSNKTVLQKSVVVEHLAKNLSYNELLILASDLAETEFDNHMKGFTKFLKKEAKNGKK